MQALYEERYCARGDMENRIKEQLMLFSDRTTAPRQTILQLPNLNKLHSSSAKL